MKVAEERHQIKIAQHSSTGSLTANMCIPVDRTSRSYCSSLTHFRLLNAPKLEMRGKIEKSER